MSQHDLNIANDTGANVRADINNALGALATNSSGASEPSTNSPYQFWADTTNGVLKRRNSGDTGWVLCAGLADAPTVAKSGAYTLALSDYGRTVTCTSSFTLTVTAAATLTDGWWCNVVNAGTGVITIDPNASETVNGATTLVLTPGERVMLWCTGSAFHAIGNSVRRAGADKNATGQTSVSSGTKVTYGTERYDRGGIYDAANSQFTGIEGLFEGGAAALLSAGVTDQVSYVLSLYKNGSLHKQLMGITASGTANVVLSGNWQEESVASDTWAVYLTFTGGGTVTIAGAATSSYVFGRAG